MESTLKVQGALNKYIPNATLLIVDHLAAHNNFNHFYHAEVHFAKGIGSTFHVLLSDTEQDAPMEALYYIEDAAQCLPLQPWAEFSICLMDGADFHMTNV